MKKLLGRALVVTYLTGPALACDRASPPDPRQLVTATREAGAWQGRGNSTLGFVSDSGRLRITWQAHAASAPSGGMLRVTVHSAVSGRPLRLVVDHRGNGGGTVFFDDDPRSYNLMVESTDVEWSISVDEFLGVYQDAPAKPPG